jgi:hypothetical protein
VGKTEQVSTSCDYAIKFNPPITMRQPSESSVTSDPPLFLAADLRIFGSGSVNASHRGFFGFMIKKWHFGDQIHDHNRGDDRYHPEASRAGI